MRRILATLLLAAISCTLAPAALLFASDDSDLPACCRRDGKHKCGMMNMADDDASGPTARGVSKCPVFPRRANSAPAASHLAGAAVPQRIAEEPLVSFPTPQEQAEAFYRISFSRSSQKRGPPSLV